MAKIYLYLARRDKSAIKLLTIFPSESTSEPTRVSDVSRLNLPIGLDNQVKKICLENKMLWEVWIEGKENYQELMESLKKRGYYYFTPYEMPMLGANNSGVKVQFAKKIKTMIRKKANY